MSAGGRQNWFRYATYCGILAAAALVFPVAGYAGRIVTPTTTLTASGAGTSEAVSADGTVLVVGAPNATVGGLTNAGAAYVLYEPNGPNSTKVDTVQLTAKSPVAHAHLGASVAISADGSTIIVGAPGSTNTNNPVAGAAYVFNVPTGPGGWGSGATGENESTKITDPNSASSDLFGTSVAVYGNDSSATATIVVGAPGASSGVGAAYLYSFSTSSVTPLSPTFTLPTDATSNPPLTLSAGESFGSSVGIDSDGGAIIVGAPGYMLSQGAAYIFTYTPANAITSTKASWDYQAPQLIASDGTAGDLFGASVAINTATNAAAATYGVTDTAVIGAPGTASGQGAAYVFTAQNGTWAQAPELTAFRGTSGSMLGESVAISSDGSTIAAGAPGAPQASSGSYSQGTVFQFDEPSRGPNFQPWSSETSATQSETYEYTKSAITSSTESNWNIGGSVAVCVPSGSNPWVFAGAPNIQTNGTTGTIYLFTGK